MNELLENLKNSQNPPNEESRKNANIYLIQ